MAERMRLSRARGWRKPEGAVVVTRPGRFGNPFRASIFGRRPAVARFDLYLTVRRIRPAGWVDMLGYPSDEEIREALTGRSLLCWCALPEPGQPDLCHAAVLMRLCREREVARV
jgi:hypothetical protein